LIGAKQKQTEYCMKKQILKANAETNCSKSRGNHLFQRERRLSFATGARRDGRRDGTLLAIPQHLSGVCHAQPG
jgi:hypothetical protein